MSNNKAAKWAQVFESHLGKLLTSAGSMIATFPGPNLLAREDPTASPPAPPPHTTNWKDLSALSPLCVACKLRKDDSTAKVLCRCTVEVRNTLLKDIVCQALGSVNSRSEHGIESHELWGCAKVQSPKFSPAHFLNATRTLTEYSERARLNRSLIVTRLSTSSF